MEKITPQPVAQELIYKSNENSVFFDVLCASPTQESEKFLGNLYVIGHVKYGDEDMGYLVSLISSLAKREYYSETAVKSDNPKAAFEHVLKKLNEVLEDFFQNKKFTLNIGLMAIAGDSIFLSRLGKFKVFLGRSGEIIDIFNNVDLFQKDHVEEKEFSNIISGKTKMNDAIFAFFPTRPLTLREKQIKEVVAQYSQTEFMEKIKDINEGAKNFSCCGVHIEIKRVVNRPDVDLKPAIQNASPAARAFGAGPPEEKEKGKLKPELPALEQPLILKDVTLTSRENIFKKTFGQFVKIRFWGSLGQLAKIRAVFILLVIVFTSIITVKIFFFSGGSKELKHTIERVKNDLKLAQTHLNQNNTATARQLVSASLLSLASAPQDKNTNKLAATLNEILDKIDLVKPGSLELISDLGSLYNADEKLNLLTVNNGNVFAFSSKGTLVKISGNEIKIIKQIEGILASKLFLEENKIIIFNGTDLLAIFDQNSQKTAQYQLKNPLPSFDSSIYQGNLYILSGVSISKYADIIKGNTESQIWLKDLPGPETTLLTIDGKIYTLSSRGLLSVFFKGKKEKDIQLSIGPSPNSALLTKKDLPYLFYIDPFLKRIMVFSKESGALNGTYKAENLSSMSSWGLDQDGTLYLLSPDQKIWKLIIQ